MSGETRLGANFAIDTTDLKAGLAQANRLIRESESQFKASAAKLDDWGSSAEGVTARIQHLNNATDLQKKKIAAMQEQYQKLIDKGIDPTSRQMVELRTKINQEQAALNKNEKELDQQTKALKEMGDESKGAAGDADKLTDSAGKTGKGLSALKGAAAIGAAAIAAVAAAAVAGVNALLDLAESTREYREDLNKLQTGFQTAGFSAEDATAAYKDLYAVIGEEDRSVEAVNHLAKLVDTQKDLANWTGTILPGVWATFGDSLPLEGLTEATNETVKVGKVTGVLADALNWASSDMSKFAQVFKKGTEEGDAFFKAIDEGLPVEDAFNAALAEMSDESERTALITETLNGLYGDAADKYKELNSSIMDANRAQSDFADAQATLGEAVEPLNTKITELKTSILTELSPALNQIIQDLTDVFGGVEGAPERLANSVSEMLGDIVAKVTEFLPQVAEFATQVVFMFAQVIIENLPEIVKAAADMFSTFLNTIADMAPSLIATIVDTVILMAQTLINNVDMIIDAGINLLEGLVDGLLEAIPQLVAAIPTIIQSLFDALMRNLPKLLNAGVRLLLELSNGLIKAIPELVAQLPTIISQIVKGLLTDGIPALLEAGGQLLAGLFEGMLNPSVIWENVKKVGSGILDGIKDFFGIHSPSRLFRDEVGAFLGEGMALGVGEGFEDKIKGVNRAIVKSMQIDSPNFAGGNTGSPAAQGGGVVVNQYNTYTNAKGSRYEIYKTKQATAAAVRLAVGGAV